MSYLCYLNISDSGKKEGKEHKKTQTNTPRHEETE